LNREIGREAPVSTKYGTGFGWSIGTKSVAEATTVAVEAEATTGSTGSTVAVGVAEAESRVGRTSPIVDQLYW